MIRRGQEGDRFLGSFIVEMYGKCGALDDARLVFDNLNVRSVFSWNNIIAAYIHHEHGREALQLFQQMQEKSVKPNSYTFSIVLGACTSQETLADGVLVHVSVIYNGLDSDVVVGTALLNMYCKCGSPSIAQRIFDRIRQQNVVSWTAMIAACVQQGLDKDALEVFRCMLSTEVKPDEFCFSTILGACSNPTILEEAKLIHARIVDCGFEANVVVATALVNMYGKCGSLEDAEGVFARMHERNVIVWTAMITACVQLGQSEKALQLFAQMDQEGLKANEVTFISVLGACASLAHLPNGMLIYKSIVNGGFESDCVVASATVNMFGKCGCPDDARRVFDTMHQRNVITWNALIAAHVHQGDSKEALQLFHQMESDDIKPTNSTFVSILSACASLASLEEGKLIHLSIAKNCSESQLLVGNALVSMYGKCGSPENAWAVFSKMPEQDVISWNAIIAAYTQHGHHEVALQLFNHMQQEGVQPNEVTFVSVLSACSRAGLVLEGLNHFFSMSGNHDMEPTMEHYGCMVDLLGRAGQLAKVEDLISKMPISPDVVAWKSFLGACRIHGDTERGKHAATHVIGMDPQEAPPFVLLSDIYAADERHGNVAEGRTMVERSV